MPKQRIFISSVQSEFALEREALHEYLFSDPLLGRFFEPFIFEKLPAVDQRVEAVYLKEVEHCHIYLGLLGTRYGSTDEAGLSPTEREFQHATAHHKTRLVFLSTHYSAERRGATKCLYQKGAERVDKEQVLWYE